MENDFIPPSNKKNHTHDYNVVPTPPPNGPYEHDHQYNFPPHSSYLSERTIGIMINKIEVLEDLNKTSQLALTEMLLNKKDVDHILENFDHRMTRFSNELKEIKELLKSLDTKIVDHVRTDTPIVDFVTTKVGKWIIALFGLAGAAIAIEFINSFVKPLFKK